MDDDRPTIRIPAFRCAHTGRMGRCPFNAPVAGGKCDLHAREERLRAMAKPANFALYPGLRGWESR